MKRLAICVLTLGIIVGSSAVHANDTFKNLWLSAYPDVCGPLITAANNCSLCHSGVPSLNPYGTDLIGQSDPTVIENMDSDGDSVVNGLEILTDCTLPGDPNSVAVDEELWSNIKRLYR